MSRYYIVQINGGSPTMITPQKYNQLIENKDNNVVVLQQRDVFP